MNLIEKTKEELLEEVQKSGKMLTRLKKKVDALAQGKEFLQTENEKFKAYFEHANDAILLFDGRKFVDCNDRALELFRCSREQLLSCDPENLWPAIQPDGVRTRDFALAQMEEALSRKGQYKRFIEWQNVRPDGTFFDSELSVSSIEINGKRYLQGILRDISDRKKVQQEKLESEIFFRTIFENSGTATIISEEDTTISLMSHEFEVLSGWTKEEVEGKMKWTEFFHPEDLAMARQYHYLRRSDPDKAPRQYVLRLIDKNGVVKTLSNTVALIPGTKKSIASFLDITEHRKVENAVQESELKYHTLFESAGNAILLIKGRMIVDCNKQTLDMFHCTRGEINNYHFRRNEVFWSEFQPDGIVSWGKMLKQLRTAKKGQGGSVYWRFKRNDGIFFDAEVNLSFLIVKNEKYLQCIIRDITDRLRAEELYRTMASTSSTAVYIIQHGKLKFVNPHTATYCGCSVDELIGMDYLSFIHPDDREAAMSNAKSMLHGETSTPFDFRIVSKDGNIRYVLGTYTYINFAGQRAILGNSMDITELKEMRSRLDELQRLETSILNTIPHAVLGVQNRGIIFANPAVERIFGWRAEELLGRDIRILYRSEEDYNESGKLVYSLLEKQGSCSLEVPCRHKDGRNLFCLLNASAIDNDVYKGRIVVIYEDITDRRTANEERKKLEAQLMQSQKMEAIGTLAGGIAHDFNNLLMGIQGCTSILMTDFDDESPHYERLRSIEHLVKSGAGLTRQLLGFARGGKYELRTININEMIEKTASLFGRTKKEITIHQNFADDIIYVDVDSGQMDQMLLNLLVNAWQAMPKGGDIYLKTEKVFLDDDFVRSYEVEPGRYAKISIADNGAGMDTKTRERIFEPFFTTKEMTKGTGLGLAIVYGIIRGHGGIITVTSRPNEGTDFNIYLPLSEKEQTGETSELDELVKGNETILLVDDEEVIIDVSREILEILGYKILVAHSGQEAINIYQEKKDVIDLVIQDMVMPGISGVETFYALKIINPAVKVILSSGYVINQQIETIMGQGCRAFIQKPFRMEELSNKIRSVLDNQ